MTKSRVRVPPAKDEWGVYDPEVAGIAAVFAWLDKKDIALPAPVSHAPSLRKDIPEPAAAPLRPGLRDAE